MTNKTKQPKQQSPEASSRIRVCRSCTLSGETYIGSPSSFCEVCDGGEPLKWKHSKRGEVVEVIDTARFNSSRPISDPLPDGSKMYVYKTPDGELHVREVAEFVDGRFSMCFPEPEPNLKPGVTVENTSPKVAVRRNFCVGMILVNPGMPQAPFFETGARCEYLFGIPRWQATLVRLLLENNADVVVSVASSEPAAWEQFSSCKGTIDRLVGAQTSAIYEAYIAAGLRRNCILLSESYDMAKFKPYTYNTCAAMYFPDTAVVTDCGGLIETFPTSAIVALIQACAYNQGKASSGMSTNIKCPYLDWSRGIHLQLSKSFYHFDPDTDYHLNEADLAFFEDKKINALKTHRKKVVLWNNYLASGGSIDPQEDCNGVPNTY